jgi:protein involved in ribonucleotide reduction
MTPLIVYFSSTSGNTERFIGALNIRSIRIPLTMKVDTPIVNEPYVLATPTYANDDGSNAVPKQVIRFLNVPQNRAMIKGVLGAGNRNFGENFGLAGRIVAKKCNVPLLYRFELSGTKDDVINVKQGMERLWNSLTSKIIMTKTQKQTHLA